MFKNALSLLCCLPFFFFACDDDPQKTGCGDGVIDTGEACDGADVPATSCAELGYYEQTGAIGCRADCTLDVSVCAGRCGDGVIQVAFAEDCEGADLTGETCATLGLGTGTLACSDTCRFDTSGCEAIAVCGDGVITAPDEACEGDDLGGETCESLGYYGGTLACDPNCGFDLASCQSFGRCGDGQIQEMYDEACEGADLGGQTCEALGYYGGQLTCGSDCRFDVTACAAVGSCGDGLLQDQHGEACDGIALGGETCESLGHHGGTLACDDMCAFDVSGCEFCGDGVVQTAWGEACDGTALGGATCLDADLFFGARGCDGACALTVGTCRDTELWGTAAFDGATAAAVDFQGNVYVAGASASALDGQIPAGNHDAFLVKFNRFGVRQWTRQWGTAEMDVARGVAVDSSGNIYVTGQTQAALDGQPYLGGGDAFLTKWSENGVKAWTRTWGTSNGDDAHAVATDALGNIYVTGQTSGALPGQVSAGWTDAYLVRFDALGNRTLTRQWGTTYSDVGMALAHDGAGAVYVTGYLEEDSMGVDTTVFLLKMNPSSGDQIWSRSLGNPGLYDRPHGVATLGTSDVFVVGITNGALDGQLATGGSDIFVTRYSSAGDKLWTRQRGTLGEDQGMGIVAAPTGFVTVVGYVGDALDGQPFAGNYDVAALRYDLDGNHQWTRAFGTSGDDFALAVAADAAGHAWIAGYTGGPLNGRTYAGNMDAFLLFLPD